MKSYKLFRVSLSIATCLLLITIATYAQPNVDSPPQDPNNPDAVPITGLEYLLISGGILGGYKLLKKKGTKA